MGKLIFSVALKLFVLCIFTSFQVSCGVSEELIITKPAPFHNLIPRFKMPPGNLLRLRIPQWEVLYFLKYGIVPFIFYDPHFNRTNFVTQVHKFKMYFDDGRPNKTSQLTLKDDESFREFLMKHGYPNYNQLPKDALSRNNKMVEEINGMLQAATSANEYEKGQRDKIQQPTNLPPLEAIIGDLDSGKNEQTADSEDEDLEVGKRGNSSDQNHKQGRQNFWSTFISRYPATWKYTRSVLGTRNLLYHDFPLISSGRTSPYSALGSNSKTFRVGIRNVNMDTGGGTSSMQGGDGAGDARKGGKTFQTQGW